MNMSYRIATFGCAHHVLRLDCKSLLARDGWRPLNPERSGYHIPVQQAACYSREIDQALLKAERVETVLCTAEPDFFEDGGILPEIRAEIWNTAAVTPRLRWLIMTDSPGNAARMLPEDWDADGRHANVCCGIRVDVMDDAAVAAISALKAAPFRFRMLDFGPLPGSPDIADLVKGFDWVLTDYARCVATDFETEPFLRGVRDACVAVGVPFFLHAFGSLCDLDGVPWRQHPFGAKTDIDRPALKLGPMVDQPGLPELYAAPAGTGPGGGIGARLRRKSGRKAGR